MRVVHICAYYLYSYMFSHLTDSLEIQGIQNDVFVPTHKNTDIAIVPAENVYHPVCFDYLDRVWFPSKGKKIYRSIIKTLDINQYDVVHAHTVFTDGNIALKLKKEYGKPYFVAVRSTDIDVFFKYMVHLRNLGLEVMENASQIIFLSNTHRRYTIETYVPKQKRDAFYEKSIVIPNGIAPVFHEHLAPHRQRPANRQVKLITVGNISKRKNQLAVCAAAEELEHRGYAVNFTVIGRPENDALYRKLISYPFVSFYPFMPQEKLIEHYRMSDVFVLTSLEETFGLVYAEAMSQGLPVVYTREQGFDGQFPEGEVGYHAAAKSVGEIADAVERILEDYNAISGRCINGTRRFDWDKIAAQYIALYFRHAGHADASVARVSSTPGATWL